MTPSPHKPTLGIIGFGAFGQLMARHLRWSFELRVHDPDPALASVAAAQGLRLRPMAEVARCDIIVIAAPVSCFEAVVGAVARYCRPGALVLDVGSVKVGPAEIMARLLPPDVDVVATHPLFGPQSAAAGLSGLGIALCPIRGDRRRHLTLAAFLRRTMGLRVILTTPDAHDREAATVQGLTHLIARVLQRMQPKPARMTTRSFELLTEACAMVEDDAPEVFEAIEKANPYAQDVRTRFFALAAELSAGLEKNAGRVLLPPPLAPSHGQCHDAPARETVG